VGETSSPFTTTSVTTETFCPEPSNSAALGALGRRNTLGASSVGRYDRPSIREGNRDRPVLVRPPDLGADTIQLRERVGVGVSVGVGLAESGVLPPLPQTSGPFTTTSVTSRLLAPDHYRYVQAAPLRPNDDQPDEKGNRDHEADDHRGGLRRRSDAGGPAGRTRTSAAYSSAAEGPRGRG
jgi:hypothetical protein